MMRLGQYIPVSFGPWLTEKANRNSIGKDIAIPLARWGRVKPRPRSACGLAHLVEGGLAVPTSATSPCKARWTREETTLGRVVGRRVVPLAGRRKIRSVGAAVRLGWRTVDCWDAILSGWTPSVGSGALASLAVARSLV